MATAKATKLIIHPPKFNGEGEVKFFLKDFERASNANGWNEKTKLEMLPNFFTGAAATWCRTYTISEEQQRLRRIGHISRMT